MDGETGLTVRPDPPMVASDRESLRGWLEFHRATLAWKCDGLDDDDLRRRSTRAEAFGAWRSEIALARSIESDITSLDRQFHVEAWDCDATLRTVLLHLIHDYARHNGHADLLREGIDGVVGA